MKTSHKGTLDCWSKGGTHALDMARNTAYGEGHVMRAAARLCLRCGVDRPTKGGRIRGGLFECALHRSTP